MKACNQKQEVLEYLREARREAVQLKEKSMSNNVKLQGQGERLDSLQDKVETINGVTVKIEENTKELSSFWYYLKVRVKNLLGFKGEEKQIEQQSSPQKETIPYVQSNNNFGNDLNQIPASEQEELIDELYKEVLQTKKLSRNFGQQATRQIAVIDNLNNNVEVGIQKVEKTNKMLKRILQ